MSTADVTTTTPSDRRSYLEWSTQGKSGFFRYLVGAIAIVIIWFVGQAIMQAILGAVLPGISTTSAGVASSDQTWAALVYQLASFLPFFVATPLIVRWIHKRPGLTVATPFLGVNLRMVTRGALLWMLIMAITMIPVLIARPSDFRVNFQPAQFIPVVLVSLVLLIWQTSAEELFFRGYLVQAFGKRWRNPVYLGIVSGVLFAIPHLANPEVANVAADEFLFGFMAYFSSGFAWAFVSVRSGTIELAIGAHFMNNLVNILVVTVESSALGPTAVLIDSQSGVVEAGVISMISAALFMVLTWRAKGSGDPRELLPDHATEAAPSQPDAPA